MNYRSFRHSYCCFFCNPIYDYCRLLLMVPTPTLITLIRCSQHRCCRVIMLLLFSLLTMIMSLFGLSPRTFFVCVCVHGRESGGEESAVTSAGQGVGWWRGGRGVDVFFRPGHVLVFFFFIRSFYFLRFILFVALHFCSIFLFVFLFVSSCARYLPCAFYLIFPFLASILLKLLISSM